MPQTVANLLEKKEFTLALIAVLIAAIVYLYVDLNKRIDLMYDMEAALVAVSAGLRDLETHFKKDSELDHREIELFHKKLDTSQEIIEIWVSAFKLAEVERKFQISLFARAVDELNKRCDLAPMIPEELKP